MKAIQITASLFLMITAGCGTTGSRHSTESDDPATRLVTVPAQPRPLKIDLRKTAVVVVDMQNDFLTRSGLLDRAGVDVTSIRKIVPRIRETLQVMRNAGLPIVYLKMGYRPDLSDIGSEGSPMGVENRNTHVGERMRAPDGREGRLLIRDTWNTDIVDELRPHKDDLIVYKTRYSGFCTTDLDAILKRRGMRTLMMMGCTASVYVESTLRDAMFRDYSPVLLADCTAEPIGQELPRSNHEASLWLIREAPFGTVTTSAEFVKAEALKR
jgi:ureidoacrylate peracid hydrolase